MIVVFPGSRQRLCRQDMDFIVSVLGEGQASAPGLREMLSDPDSLEIILDDPRLYQAACWQLSALNMGPPVTYQLLIHQALAEVGMHDRQLDRYLGSLVGSLVTATHGQAGRMPELIVPKRLPGMVQSLGSLTEEGRFLLLAYLGNTALSLTGLFPERIRYMKARRGEPDFAYCEKLGRASFLAAANHHLAGEFLAEELFAKLAHNFARVRMALNRVAEQGIVDDVAARWPSP